MKTPSNKPEFRAGEKTRVRLNTQYRIIDPKARIVEYVGSTERVDRYGTSLRGWALTEYRKNPVFLYGHNSYFPPIGAAKRVWLDKERNLMFRIAYVPGDLFPFAEFVYKMVEGQWIRATSVGFIPGKVEWPEERDQPVLLLDNELLELSQVTVPANPDALANAVRSLSPRSEYLHLCAANIDLSKEQEVDGRGIDDMRAAVLEWADSVGWSGEVEDESREQVSVPETVEPTAAEQPAADGDPDETEGGEGDASATEETAPEGTAEGEAEAEVAAEGEAEDAGDEAAEETAEEAAAEGDDGAEGRAVDPLTPKFTVSFDAIGGGMARILMADYETAEDFEDALDEFDRLVDAYAKNGRTLPTMIVEDREFPVDQVDRQVLRDGEGIDFRFHEGERELWEAKRARVMRNEGAVNKAAEGAPAATSVAAQGAPDVRNEPTPAPTFGGGGGGGGGGSRKPAPTFARKSATTPPPVSAEGDELRETINGLRAAIASEMDEIRAAVEADEDFSERVDAVSDLRTMLADLEGQLAEDAPAETEEEAAETPEVTAEEVVEADGEERAGEPSPVATLNIAAAGAPTVTAPMEVANPRGMQPNPAVDEQASRAMLRELVSAAVSEAIRDMVSVHDLSDLAIALGVDSWADFKAEEGRTCADFLSAMVEAAEKRTAPLAEGDMSEVLRRLESVERAVSPGPGSMTEAGRSLVRRERRPASAEVLNRELEEVAARVGRMEKVSAPAGPRTAGALRKRSGRHKWWGA